jgi:hypothetical protein
MTEIDGNYIARTHGTDALRRTIDSDTSTRGRSDGEQHAGTADEFSAGILTDLAPVEDEGIEVYAAVDRQKPSFDANAPATADSDGGWVVTAPYSQSTENTGQSTENTGQRQRSPE